MSVKNIEHFCLELLIANKLLGGLSSNFLEIFLSISHFAFAKNFDRTRSVGRARTKLLIAKKLLGGLSSNFLEIFLSISHFAFVKNFDRTRSVGRARTKPCTDISS